MSAVELRHLRALVALTEEGTFTDAAIRLRVGQPAVSRLITGLEDALGVRLVERTTRTVALTDAGRRCYAAAVQALAAVDEVERAAQGTVRPLRLGYAWSALGRWTSEVLQTWRTQRTDVPLEVHRVDNRWAGLTAGRVDIAVVRGAIHLEDLPDEFVVRALPAEARMAALPVSHPLAGRTELTLGDLTGSTVLLTGNGTTTLDLWPAGGRPTRTLRVDNVDEWLTEIAGGLAVGVTAESTQALHAHPGIRYVPLAGAPPVEVHLAWFARHAHPAAAQFADVVEGIVAH